VSTAAETAECPFEDHRQTDRSAEFAAFRPYDPLLQLCGLVRHQRIAKAERDSSQIENFRALPHDSILQLPLFVGDLGGRAGNQDSACLGAIFSGDLRDAAFPVLRQPDTNCATMPRLPR
jgi:hypothetical protein